MKTIKMLFAILGAATFLAACNNPGNNQQEEEIDTSYMEPAPPLNDTLMDDTIDMMDTMETM